MNMKLVTDAANLATVKARLQEDTALITPHKSAKHILSYYFAFVLSLK